MSVHHQQWVCANPHLKSLSPTCDLWRLGQRANNFALGPGGGVRVGRHAAGRQVTERPHQLQLDAQREVLQLPAPTQRPIPSPLARRATVRRRADADDGRGRRVVKVSGSLLAARLASPFARLRNVAGGNGELGGGRAERGRDEGERESAEKSKLSSSAPALGQAIAATDRATSLLRSSALDGERERDRGVQRGA